MGFRGRFAQALGWLWVAATVAASGCGGSAKGASGGTTGQGGTGGIDGGVDGPGAAVFTHPFCDAPYPAQACDGDPHGPWTLAALCVNRYQDCPGAIVKPSGTASGSIDFQDGSPDAYFEYLFNYDIETRYSVPPSCIAGGSCESIGCFAGDNPCSCVVGNGSGGGVRARWTPNITGEVVATTGSGMLRFCAGATTADSLMEGTRVIWNRACVENMDCRPTNPCHHGHAHCTAGAVACEDTGSQRQVGTACGTDRVCDATGACVACAAGGSCQLPNRPCKTAVISCSTATPVCTATADLADGAACGVKRACLGGVCKSDDGESCTADAECRESCTCGDAQCSTRFCGRSCTCQYAPPGGACAGPLADATAPPVGCNKACYQGRCLTAVGQTCTRDVDCGTGHCTCWNSGCNGGRVCSKTACPCQYANSGADTCTGPLLDGLMDLTCSSPRMCVQGACQ
jgi:hypothetical protein